MYTKILNIGAGKPTESEIERFLGAGNSILTCVDRGYPDTERNLNQCLKDAYYFNTNGIDDSFVERVHFSSCDLFDFMDGYQGRFHYVFASRIFEHMEYCNGEIGRLLEACNNITEEDAVLEIIVPNALLVAKKMYDYESNYEKMDQNTSNYHKLIINSEFTNIKADPHASVWTPVLAKEYILSEGTWTIVSIENLPRYKCRDIYMKIICIKGSLHSTHLVNKFHLDPTKRK